MGLLLESSLLLLYFVTGLNRTSTLLEPYFGVSFAVYAGAVIWVMKTKPKAGNGSTFIIALFGCVMGATFLLQTPTLSGDIYRYIWDGKLITHGISPYSFPPYASQLASLRDSNWLLVEDKDIISPYPPLLELLNGAVYAVSPTVTAFKLAFLIPDFATIVTLPFFLRKLGFDPRLSVIYSWNPLLILEFSSSGHDDPLAVFLVLMSLYLLIDGRRLSSAALMGLAILSKLFPILFVPILVKKWGIKGSAVIVALVFAFYLPFTLSTGNLVSVLAVYVVSNRSEFNAGAFAVLQYLFQPLGANAAFDASRAVEYLVFFVVLAWLTLKTLKGNPDFVQLIRYAGIVLTVYLAMSSTIQPWYLAWVLVPFVVMMPSASWILFSGMIFLTYYTFTQPPIQPGYWAEILWVKVAEFAQLYGFLAYELIRGRYLKPWARNPAPYMLPTPAAQSQPILGQDLQQTIPDVDDGS
jgi:hypothetical protein